MSLLFCTNEDREADGRQPYFHLHDFIGERLGRSVVDFSIMVGDRGIIELSEMRLVVDPPERSELRIGIWIGIGRDDDTS